MRNARGVLTILAAGFLTFRAARAIGAFHLSATLDALTMGAGFVVVGAALIANYVRTRQLTQEADELRETNRRLNETIRSQSQEAREAEERSWWNHPVDEDTVAFGDKVIVLTDKRLGRAQRSA